MSASILWKPVTPSKTRSLDIWAPQHFMEVMESTFGNPTPLLSHSDLPVLRGMAAVWGEKEGQRNPFVDLVNAINKNGAIQLEVEY